ncbi:hypothetical protein EV122DRAFT_224917 [Schizophyllum commune]
MAGTFLETYTRDVSLCDHCGHSVHLQLDVPPSASENSILRDNRELSVVDMKKAEEGLLEMEKALLQLEKAQDALQVASRHIQEVAHELKSRREVHRAYLAPIRRLPEELLLEIMRHSCEGGSQLEGDEPMPLVLTSVCKTWRDTACATKQIWADFILLNTGYDIKAPILRRLKIFLSRSGSLPFRRCVVHYRVALQNLAVSDPLAILLDYTHRWTKLVIDVHLSLQGHLAGRLEGKSFACLESIACERLVFAEDNMKGIFGSLPSLRAVTLHTEDESSNPELALPWEQLVEVHTQMPPAHAVDLARRCPNLVHWSYADRFTEPWHHGHLSNEEPLTVTLPHLRTINIKQRHRVGVPLLDRLITPSLEEAVLDYSAVPTVDQTGFPLLITRSQCRLQHLSLYSSHTLKGVFLTLLPELTSLKLYPGKGSKALKSHFIDLLAMGDGIGLPCFLPNMKELFISGSMQASPETVSAMIDARKELGRPIESLSLHIDPDTDSSGRMSEYDRLRALVPNFNCPVYSPMYNEPLAYFSI